MIQFASKNIRFLNWVYEFPVLKYFFVVHIDRLRAIDSEKIIENFFRFLYVTDGPSKQTKQGRFATLNENAAKYLHDGEIKVHDVGVSNGITSLELNQYLAKMGKNAKLTISDKFSRFTVKKGRVTKVYDADNNLMFGYIFGAVASKNMKTFFISKWLFSMLERFSDGKDIYTISLFHPMVMNAIEANELKEIEYDIFTSKNACEYDFVRCMNVLNLGYFGSEMNVVGLRNLVDSLKENGLLLVGRTSQNGEQNATFYRKEQDRLKVLEHINAGTEIQHLAEII